MRSRNRAFLSQNWAPNPQNGRLTLPFIWFSHINWDFFGFFCKLPGSVGMSVDVLGFMAFKFWSKESRKYLKLSRNLRQMRLICRFASQLNVVFNSLPFWVSAIYFPVKQREKKKKVLARRRGKGKAKRGKKGTK